MKRLAAAWVFAGIALLCVGEPALAARSEFPQWGSLKADKVNMHVGPGFDYRKKYVYQRKGLPVKVLRAMGGWWLVEDPDGARGWMLQRMVGKAHTGIVRDDIAELRESAGGSRLLWRVRRGVVGRLDKCAGDWCRFTVDARQGYVNRRAVWGAEEF